MEFGLSGIKAETEPVEPKEMIEVDPNSMVGNRPQDEPWRSEQQRRPPIRYGFNEHADMVTVKNDILHVVYNVCQIVEPKTMGDALASDHAKEWKAAADSEDHSWKMRQGNSWSFPMVGSRSNASGCLRSKWNVSREVW